MVNYSLVIGKNFLGERHEEENIRVVGANAEDAKTQYWVDETTDGLIYEEHFFDHSTGDYVISLINQKNDSLFISLTVPFKEWVVALDNLDTSIFSKLITKLENSKKAIDLLQKQRE